MRDARAHVGALVRYWAGTLSEADILSVLRESTIEDVRELDARGELVHAVAFFFWLERR